ncbi:hypothetical protein AALP_AA1G317200 [Arabis alpina]|uniref:Nucleotide-diphospho-sugar transferase domain-containing protein n=1 Tax=Arabis alpina TaxID=50452 RepID=A0A087HRZ6_ARAAL|nr:hypothetical protein AALP_AA1G317200 [Arabis alpina]
MVGGTGYISVCDPEPRPQKPLKKIVFLLTFTLFLCSLLYHKASHVPTISLPQLPNISVAESPLIAADQELVHTDTFEADDTRNLARILKEASTEEKTVIVTMMNQAYAKQNSTFDLFLEGFRVGQGTEKLLRHVMVVCFDKKAYSRCVEVFPSRCYLLRTAGLDFSGEKRFMARDYLKMMWRRTEFLGSLLRLGYNFLFTDMDILWLRDPFPRLVSDADFQIACDYFNGNVSDARNYANGGFKFVKANRRTIEFYKYWYESRLRFPGKNEQDVINKIKYDEYINKIGLKMKFIDPKDVADFCQSDWDINKVCTMHGNCCIGMDNKLKDLRQVLEDWRDFMSNIGQKRGFRKPMNCWRSIGRKVQKRRG